MRDQLGRLRWYVTGRVSRAGRVVTLSRTFHARSAVAARRYWSRWVVGSGYELRGVPRVVVTR